MLVESGLVQGNPEKCLMVGNDVSEHTVMEQLDMKALMPTDRLISGGLCYFRGNLQFVFILPVTA